MCSQSHSWEMKGEQRSWVTLVKSLARWGPVCLPSEGTGGRDLDGIIESLGASEASVMEASPPEPQDSAHQVCPAASEEPAEGERPTELLAEEEDVPAEEESGQEKEEADECELVPSLEESPGRRREDAGGVEPVSGLRRRNRPE